MKVFWDKGEWILYAHHQRSYFPVFTGFDTHLTEEQLQGITVFQFPQDVFVWLGSFLKSRCSNSFELTMLLKIVSP